MLWCFGLWPGKLCFFLGETLHWWQLCLTLVNPMVTSIWQIGQTVLSSHLHLSHGKMGLGSVFFWWRCSAMLSLCLLLEVTLLPRFAQKVLCGIHTYQHIFTWSYWLWHLEWQCLFWEHIVACFHVIEMICVTIFLCLLCCWLISKSVVTITLTLTLQVGFSAPVAQAYLLYNFDFIDTLCIWHAEFGPTVAIGLLISYTDVM